MTQLYLVRHGQATKKWGDHLDPDLAPQGHVQAEQATQHIEQHLPRPIKIVSSPMKRCRQTAAPLAALWQKKPQIAAEVIEVPSPNQYDGKSLANRTIWLQEIFNQNWSSLRDQSALITWRQNLLNWLLSCEQPQVVFTHFVAINVASGFACGDNRLISRWPDYCSMWVFETDGVRLNLVEAGREIETKVL